MVGAQPCKGAWLWVLGDCGMAASNSASPAAVAVEVGPVLEQAAGVLAAAVRGQHLGDPQLVEVRARCVKHQRGALLHLKMSERHRRIW